MSTLSRDEVTAVVGPVGDIVAAEIIATGVTREELVEAKTWLASEHDTLDVERDVSEPRVAAAILILERIKMDPRFRSPLGEGGSTLR